MIRMCCFALAVVPLVPCALFAGFNGVLSYACTAEAVLSSPAQTGFEITLCNPDGTPADPQEITWDTGNIVPGRSEWVCAPQYLRIGGSFSVGSAIQIYTDNCSADADPQFFIQNPSSCNPAGLLDAGTRSKPLPVCWRIAHEPLNTKTMRIHSRLNGTAQQLFDPAIGPGYPCYLWMKDRSTPGNRSLSETPFTNGEDYIRVWEEDRGCQVAEGTWAETGSPNYIYLGANFRNASSPETYRTGSLVIEMFSE